MTVHFVTGACHLAYGYYFAQQNVFNQWYFNISLDTRHKSIVYFAVLCFMPAILFAWSGLLQLIVRLVLIVKGDQFYSDEEQESLREEIKKQKEELKKAKKAQKVLQERIQERQNMNFK